MSDETKSNVPPAANPEAAKLPTLAETSGVSQEAAAAAIASMNARFDKLAEENGQLKRQLIAQQAQIEKMNAGTAAQKFGQVPINVRHCNLCGAEVEAGERCPKHKAAKINEVGMMVKHGRMQPVIVRQV